MSVRTQLSRVASLALVTLLCAGGVSIGSTVALADVPEDSSEPGTAEIAPQRSETDPSETAASVQAVEAPAAEPVADPVAPAPVPTVTVESTIVPDQSLTLQLSGSGFAVQQTSFGVRPAGSESAEPVIAAVAIDIPADGTVPAGATLEVPAVALQSTGTYELVAWPSAFEPSTANLLVQETLTIDWAALAPTVETEVLAPTEIPLAVGKPTAAALKAQTASTIKLVAKSREIAGVRVDVSVTGSGFKDVQKLPGQDKPHVYLAFIPKGTDLATIGQGGDYPNISVDVEKPSSDVGIVAGTLNAPIEGLDRTKSYEVISWPSRSNPTDTNIYGRTDVSINWDALYPEDAVVVNTKVAKADKKSGLSVAVDAENFQEDVQGSRVTAALVEQGKNVTKRGDVAGYFDGIPEADGVLTGTLSATPKSLDRSKTYEVRIFSGTDFSTAAKNQLARATVKVTQANWDTIFGAATPAKVVVNKVSLTKAGIRVDTRATGLPSDKIYVAVIERGSEAGLTQDGGYADFLYQPPVTNGRGDFTFVLSKNAIDRKKSYEVLIWQSHSNPSASTIYGRADIDISQKQWDGLAGTTPEKPTEPTGPKPAATGAAAPGSLTWGISSAFADYTTNPNRAGGKSGGEILTQGVGSSGGAYLFPQAAGGSWNAQSQTGTVQFSGVVTFTAHKGLMNESFANPLISVSSATSGTITVSGRSFPLDLGSANKSVGQNGEVTWSNVPVSGAISGGSGGAGGSLAVDPLSFTVGSASQVSFASTSVGGDDTPKRTAAATAPTTTGISVLTDAKKIKPGGRIELEGRGFDPSDKGVLVVLYGAPGSDPIVLDEEASASVAGVVSWSGTLPKEATGDHTITLQGSINAGAVIDILDEDRVKKAAAESKVELVEAEQAQAAGVAPVAVATTAQLSTWEWWASAGGLVAIAACMTLLVIRQRKLTP